LVWLANPSSAQLHKDERHGFQFKPPRDFNALALKPEEKRTVAKYQCKQADSTSAGTKIWPRFQVLRWPVEKQKEVVPDIVWQYLEKSLNLSPKKEKSVSLLKQKCPEKILLSDSGRTTYQCTVVVQDDATFALLAQSSTDRFSKWQREFAKAAKSFKRIDKKDAAARAAELSGLSEVERFLQEQIDKLPPGWEWQRSERYLFLYNADKSFIKDCERRIEAIRNEYERLFPPREPIEAISIVRVVNSQEEYIGYGGSSGANGHWSSRNKELVLFDRRPREKTMETLLHEAFHQYIYYWAGQLAPHSWYNEGHGDYFGGARMTKSGRVTEFGPRRHTQRLPTVKDAHRENRLIPLRDLMRWTQRQFYGGQKSLAYAQGWALVHMLRESKKLNKQHRSLLSTYLENLLAARHEVATSTMSRLQREAEKREKGSSESMSQDAKDYYARVNRDTAQGVAFKMTFGQWNKADWDQFEAVYEEYVDSL
jgi:hypothetical protein